MKWEALRPFACCALLCGPALADIPEPLGAFLEQHCTECHDADVKKGGLDLASLPFDLTDPDAFRHWQRVFERVRDGEMPPAKEPQLDKAALQAFLKGLKSPLLNADASDIAANGRVRSRRLTRTEYENTVHDLLGIDIPLKELLPEDRLSHGFETVSEGQQLSQHQLARYLDVADIALNAAFDRALKQDEQFSKHCTPEDLIARVRGNYRGPDMRDGRSLSWPITLQFFGKMEATKVPEDGWYRITIHDVEAVNPNNHGVVWGTLRSGQCISSAPMLYMIGLVEATTTPRDLVYEAWMQKGHMLELKPNDATLKRAGTGGTGGSVSFEGRDLAKDGFSGIAHRGIDLQRIYPVADRDKVKQILFGGKSIKNPKEDPAISLDELVARFAKRAFRRPVTDEEMTAYRDLGRKVLTEGGTLPDALRASYRAILCSPRFLTFVERPGKLDGYAIASRLSYALWVSMPDAELIKLANEHKLHDPAVLAQQFERMLGDPKADRFVRSFTDQWLKLREIDFTNPDTKQFPTFDAVVQQSMLEETRAYVTEVIKKDLAITHLVDSDFAFLNERLARHYKLMDDPSTGRKAGGGRRKFKNNKEQESPVASTPTTPGLLTSPLQIGEGLQEVKLSPTAARGGLMTQGAVLKVTADGSSTSPVVRGLFINERLLGEHVPPPPPGVPAIEPDIRGATSIREQLEKHRSNATCAACHQIIDPPGFALENYDPVGVWRSRYGKDAKGVDVNPSGITPEGKTFDDLAAWKKIYTQRSDQLARAFVGQFLTYSTGAAIRFSDEQTIAKLVENTANSGYGLRSLMREAVMSPVFLRK